MIVYTWESCFSSKSFLNQIANEISDAISNPVGMGADYDEDELLAELDELEQEELDKHLLEVHVAFTAIQSSEYACAWNPRCVTW